MIKIFFITILNILLLILINFFILTIIKHNWLYEISVIYSKIFVTFFLGLKFFK